MRTVSRLLALLGRLALVGAAGLMVLRFAPSQSWWPSVQAVVLFPVALPLALAGMVLLLVARRWWSTLVAGGLAAVMAVTLSARVVDRSVELGAADEALRVGTFNAYFGRADVKTFVRTVQAYELDVLCVAEATPDFEAAAAEAGLTAYLPVFVSLSEAGASGSVLYSRLPMREMEPMAYSQFRMPRAQVTTAAGVVTVTCAHPVPPVRSDIDWWSGELNGLADAVEQTPGRQVVMGDFNATWDHRLLRQVAERGNLVRAANEAGHGLTPTWPVIGFPAPVPFAAIDHVLTDLPVADADVIEIPGSDHRMVTAVLRATN